MYPVHLEAADFELQLRSCGEVNNNNNKTPIHMNGNFIYL